ncbi:RNA-directed DNA polymerase from mobile element jockey [Trichonephila clavipes]|nr:RNA-directed DNA polymerase from mobile element jockey [Trichonephila clavipes]
MFLVQETWLEPGIDPQIANYRLTKDDRIEFPHTATRGGTAIYCKNEIVHHRVPLPNLQGMDATAVQIKINNFPPINVVSAYVRRRAGHSFPVEDFKKIFTLAVIVSSLAEVIADSLQVQFEPNHVAGRELFDQRIHDEVTNFINTPHVQEIEPTTPTEVLSYVQRLKPRKSPDLIRFLIQCGFRPKCSTVHQLLRVTELIHSGFAKHEATGILFLDIAKAFDKIWHDGLLIKLIRLDFPPLIKSIHSFLSDRSFRVRVDKTLSSPRPIRSGLPQGSLSSPLLFTLYVNDMPQTGLSHLAMFADDTAIITQNKRFSVVISNLQHYVSLLELWLTDWKIKVNASKSACLMFTRRPRLPVGLTPSKFLANPSPGYMLQST